MGKNITLQNYERKISPYERMLNRSPYSVVTMVARIIGNITESMVKEAIKKVQMRHSLLRSRIIQNEDHTFSFTSDGAGEIPFKTLSRNSNNHWMQVMKEDSKSPFDFDKYPPVRFILLQDKDEDISDLIILCYHVICDGLSLAYLARDIMVSLGYPDQETEIIKDPLPVSIQNFPADLMPKGFIAKVMAKINNKWNEDPIYFDNQDYIELTKAYWNNFDHRAISIEFSQEETKALVKKCKEENVSVNTVLTAACIGAQVIVQGQRKFHSQYTVATSFRDLLPHPPGEGMGFFAGGVNSNFKYKINRGFWENTKKLHQKLTSLYTAKNIFKESTPFLTIEPTLMESRNFKVLGGFVSPESPRYDKIHDFSQKEDVVSSIMKRSNADTVDKVLMGTAVTNLTRMKFPEKYGNLELERLIFHPGGGFPLVTVNMVLGAVTCSGKLSLVFEYAEEQIKTAVAEKVREKFMELIYSD